MGAPCAEPRCGEPEDYHLHLTSDECTVKGREYGLGDCQAPQDHHKYHVDERRHTFRLMYLDGATEDITAINARVAIDARGRAEQPYQITDLTVLHATAPPVMRPQNSAS
jgi:hypothetical protein